MVKLITNKYFLTISILVFPLLFIWQGLDFTDTGFMLTNYQQIFNDPTSVESSCRILLTNILGGIWVYFFGDSLGYIGYKVAAVLLVYAIVYLVYIILKPHLNERHILLGVLLSVIFINRSGYQFNYNSLTAFFYVLSAYFMVKGLHKNKNPLIFISAFLLGLNIFVRLPNVLGFSLIFSIPFYGYINKTSITALLKQVKYFVLGYLSAILFFFLGLYLLGYLDTYISSFIGAFSMLGDSKSHHASGYLLNVILDLYKATLYKIEFIAFLFTAISVTLSVTGRLNKKVIQYLIICTTAVAWLYIYQGFYNNWYAMISSIHAVLYIMLAIILFNTDKERNDLRLIAFIALIILIIAPLGSANGFVNAVFGMYISIPLIVGYLSELKRVKIHLKQLMDTSAAKYNLRLKENEIKAVKVIAVAIFFVFSLSSAYNFTYRDSSVRPVMAYQVDHPMLKGVLTTKERSQVVQELLDVLPQYVKEDDYLLAYEQVSLVHFLTKTKPYLYGSWPMLYNSDQFKQALDRAVEERPYLPVIIRAKGNTEEVTWPQTKGLRPSIYFNKIREIMDGFIEVNGYKTAWQNSFFEILVPKERGK